MASTLSVRLVSPEREVFKGEASSVVAPAWDGMVGILPGHAAYITLLGHGNLDIGLPGGRSERYYVAGGVMKVEADELTILVEVAAREPPEVLPPEALFHPEDLEVAPEASSPGKPVA